MTKRTFTKQQMLAVLDGDEGEIVLDKITDTSRWSVHHELVFRPEGEEKLYRASYSVGATEQQDEGPWEYEETVDTVEVEAYEKTVTDYRPVPERNPS